jgi:hypothetical protein
MNGPGRRLAATAVLLPAVVLAAGCTGTPATSAPATQATPPAPSLDTAAGTWAAVVMGGTAAQYNNFWQLFIRPAGSSRWKLVTPPLPLHGGTLASASFGPGATAAIITSASRGQITAGAGSAWLPLPPLPPGTATLVPGPGGAADALAVRGGTLTVWQHAPGGTTWAKIHVINVPIPYGSSS